MSENQSPPKKRKLNKRHVKAITHLVENPKSTVSEAMREAGYSEATIDHPIQNFIALPGVQSTAALFQLKLHERITDERIINKLDKLMDAQKVVSAVIVGKDADSRTNDFIEVDDAPTQLKATQLVMQAKQLLNQVGNQTNVQVNFGDLKNKYSKDQ